jgi:hypothetical protein
MDINGLSDPFCRLNILPTGGKVRENICVYFNNWTRFYITGIQQCVPKETP